MLTIICIAFLFTEFIKLLKRGPSSEAKSIKQATNQPTEKDWQFIPVMYTSYH
jgi:hypothetical protein